MEMKQERNEMQGGIQRSVRVLVADDSAVMRGVMRTLFLQQTEKGGGGLLPMELCGEARDGVECLEAMQRLQPDVLLLDLEMPRMHGLDVLDRLQAQGSEVPVIMCSAYTERGARSTLDALARGASDYVMKPSEQSDFSAATQVLAEHLFPKIAALALCGRSRSGPSESDASRAGVECQSAIGQERGVQEGSRGQIAVVVIGVSTGGPSALEVMLPRLPVSLPVPVLIVQHMPKVFTGALAERLDQCCGLRVREAYEGAAMVAGTVWIAPGDMHMEVSANRRTGGAVGLIHLHQEKPLNFCRPSVDHLFFSAARAYGARTLAVVMTGMGADGLAGARAVHAAGGEVLTQDEASSVVWGMPGRVSAAGIASATLPLTELAEELKHRVMASRGGKSAGACEHDIHSGSKERVITKTRREVSHGVL